MRKQRNIICLLLAAMLLTALSGCNSDSAAESRANDASGVSRREDDSTDDSTDDNAESDDDKKDDGDDSIDEDTGKEPPESSVPVDTGTQADYDAAKAALDTFLDAVQRGDPNVLYDSTTADAYFELLVMEYEEYEAGEEVQESDKAAWKLQALNKTLGDYELSGLVSILNGYEIGDGALRADCLQAYEAMLEDMRTQYIAAAEDSAFIMQYLDAYPKFEKVYLFSAELTDGDETAEMEFTVVQQSDAWKVDLHFVTYLVGYVKKAQCSAANASASDIARAVSFAIADMSDAGMPVALLCGKEYEFEGSDFQDVTEPESVTTAEEALQALKYQIMRYFSDAKALREFAFLIDEGGACTAAAVLGGTSFSAEGGEIAIYGAYPNALTLDDQSAALTLHTVLRQAAAE